MTIKGSIDRLEDDFAVIFLSNGRRVDWPITALPDDLGEGDAIAFSINENAADAKNREDLTKELLNQLLR